MSHCSGQKETQSGLVFCFYPPLYTEQRRSNSMAGYKHYKSSSSISKCLNHSTNCGGNRGVMETKGSRRYDLFMPVAPTLSVPVTVHEVSETTSEPDAVTTRWECLGGRQIFFLNFWIVQTDCFPCFWTLCKAKLNVSCCSLIFTVQTLE